MVALFHRGLSHLDRRLLSSLVGFAVAVIIILVSVALTTRNALRLERLQKTQTLANRVHHSLDSLDEAVGQRRVHWLQALVTPDPNPFSTDHHVRQALEDLGRCYQDRASRLPQLAQLQDSLQREADALKQGEQLLMAGKRGEAEQLWLSDATREATSQLDRAIATLRGIEEAEADDRDRLIQGLTEQSNRALVLIAWAGLLLGGSVGYLIVRNQANEAQNLARLQGERERLQVTLNSIADGVITTDPAGRVTHMNAVAETLSGVPLSDARNQPVEVVLPCTSESGSIGFEHPVRVVLRTGEVGVWPQPLLLRTPGRAELPLDMTLAPIRTPSRDLLGSVLVFRDSSLRRQNERLMAQARAYAERIIDTIGEALVVLGADMRVQSANRVFEDLFGLPVGSYTGRLLSELPGADWANSNLIERLRALMATETPFARIEVQHRGGDGVGRTLEVTARKLVFGDGPDAVLVALADITTHRQSEAALAESQQFLRSSLDALTAHIAVLDESGTILEVNEAWRQFSSENGLTGDPCAVGDNYLAACESGEADCNSEARAVTQGIRAVINGVVPHFTLEYACHSPEQERWHQMHATRFVGPNGVRVVVAHENTTDRHLTVALTQMRSDQLKHLADVSSHVHLATDVRSVVAVITQQALQLLDANQAVTIVLPDAESPGTHAAAFTDKYVDWRQHNFPADGSGFFSSRYQLKLPLRLSRAELAAHPHWAEFAADQSGPPLSGLMVAPLLGRDGRDLGLLQVSDRVKGEFSEDDANILGQLAQMAAVAIENARLYDRLLQADRQKNEFLAMLAHELRNPLAPIRNAVEILRRAPDQPDRIRSVQGIVDRQLSQMVRLVDDLLDVSRVSRGQIMLQKEPTALADVMRQAVETCRPVVEASQHSLTVDLPETPLILDADPTRLAQILSNLITNAAKYTPANGQITVRGAEVDGEAVVRVEDNGVGLPPAMLTKVFEMFTQVDTSLERSQGGLGIGLTLVQRLTELHGGRISAKSAGLGQGATFILTLPLLPMSKLLPTEPSPAAATSTEPLRILIADDNEDSAASLAMMLSLLDHEVQTAGDGQEAVEIAERFRPQVVLTDLGMPKLNGYEVAQALRQRPWAEQTLLVALTGWSQDEAKSRAADAGFHDHLVKPIDFATLAKILGRVASR